MEYLFLNGMGSCQPIVGIQSQTYFCACLRCNQLTALPVLSGHFPKDALKNNVS